MDDYLFKVPETFLDVILSPKFTQRIKGFLLMIIAYKLNKQEIFECSGEGQTAIRTTISFLRKNKIITSVKDTETKTFYYIIQWEELKEYLDKK